MLRSSAGVNGYPTIILHQKFELICSLDYLNWDSEIDKRPKIMSIVHCSNKWAPRQPVWEHELKKQIAKSPHCITEDGVQTLSPRSIVNNVILGSTHVTYGDVLEVLRSVCSAAKRQ